MQLKAPAAEAARRCAANRVYLRERAYRLFRFIFLFQLKKEEVVFSPFVCFRARGFAGQKR